MIIKSLFDAFFMPVEWLIGLVPELSTIEIPSGIFNTLKTWFAMCGSILPLDTVLILLKIKLTILGVSVAWNVILRIKSFVPIPSAGN